MCFLTPEVIAPLGCPGPGCQGLLLPGLLLAGDGLLPALAGTCVGLRPLAVHRQPPAMPDALVAADLDLAADIGLDLAAKVAFDLVVGVDPVAQLQQVVFGEVVDPGVRAHAGGGEGLKRAGAADPVDVGERDLKPLVARQVNAGKTGHVRAVLLRVVEVLRTASRPCPGPAPASNRGTRPMPPAVRVLLRVFSLRVFSLCAAGPLFSPGAACAGGPSR